MRQSRRGVYVSPTQIVVSITRCFLSPTGRSIIFDMDITLDESKQVTTWVARRSWAFPLASHDTARGVTEGGVKLRGVSARGMRPLILPPQVSMGPKKLLGRLKV